MRDARPDSTESLTRALNGGLNLGVPMGVLTDEIAAFERMQDRLEAEHLKEWVVFHKGRLEGVFPDFEHAAEFALDRFDREPCLIRQIGAGPTPVGGGLIFHPANARDSRGL